MALSFVVDLQLSVVVVPVVDGLLPIWLRLDRVQFPPLVVTVIEMLPLVSSN